MSIKPLTTTDSVEIELRAKFQRRLDAGIGLPIKPFSRYMEEARLEIEDQHRQLISQVKSMAINTN